MILSNYLCCDIKMQNKCIRLLFLILSVLFFFVYISNIFTNVELKFMPFNLIFTNNKENNTNRSGVILMKIERNEWVVQFNVAQYSSILVEHLDGTVDIEALFFHDNATKIDYIRKNVKCFSIDPDKNILETKLNEILLNPFEVLEIDGGASIWLVKCKMKNNTHDHDYIGIIDKNAFEKSYNISNGSNDYMFILKAQKPSHFKR